MYDCPVSTVWIYRDKADRCHPPIIFITGHGDIPSTVRAMTAGAVVFLPKLFGQEQPLWAIEEALVRDIRPRLDRTQVDQLKERSLV